MPDWLIPYQPSLFALLATAGLMLGQLLVLDFSMIKAKQPQEYPLLPMLTAFCFVLTVLCPTPTKALPCSFC